MAHIANVNDPKLADWAKAMSLAWRGVPLSWAEQEDGSLTVVFMDGRKINSKQKPPTTDPQYGIGGSPSENEAAKLKSKQTVKKVAKHVNASQPAALTK